MTNPAHREPTRFDDGTVARREPNYLVRRAIVVAAVVVAVAVIAIAVGWLIGGDDSPSTATADASDWDTIVVLDGDEIRLTERDTGEQAEVFRTARDLDDVQSLVTGDVLVTMTDEGQIVQTDLTDGAVRRGLSGEDERLSISPDNPAIATSVADGGGDVTIIDTRERSTLSVADIAGLDDPLIFGRDVLINPSGSHAAVPVPTAFQSVVVDLDADTSFALGGRVIAMDDARIVTEQPAGDESELEFYDLARDRLGSVDVPAPRANLLRSDGRLLVVDEDGDVSLVDADGTIEEVGELVDPDGRPVDVEAGTHAADGDRLLVIGSRSVYVLDADGNQVGAVAGDPATTTRSGARCVMVDARGQFALLDLDGGDVLLRVDGGTIGATSYDGCTVSLVGADPRLVHDAEVIDVGADSIGPVAPDGAGFVAVADDELVYVEIDQDRIDVGPRGATVHFGQRG